MDSNSPSGREFIAISYRLWADKVTGRFSAPFALLAYACTFAGLFFAVIAERLGTIISLSISGALFVASIFIALYETWKGERLKVISLSPSIDTSGIKSLYKEGWQLSENIGPFTPDHMQTTLPMITAWTEMVVAELRVISPNDVFSFTTAADGPVPDVIGGNKPSNEITPFLIVLRQIINQLPGTRV
ncbi:MAG: hypothetical protein HY255_02635 [Betaproteobacteria bacterium]|nr:hypothetical protein [Betaproteobacteria bacterium]